MTAEYRDDKDNEFAKPAVLYILPHKFQKKRLMDMKQSMLNKKIIFLNELDSKVTHIVTECLSYEQAMKFLDVNKAEVPKNALIVSTSWLVECLKNSKVLPVLECHRIKKVEKKDADHVDTSNVTEVSDWACKRGATLTHCNEKFTEALELLQNHAELRNEASDYSRALAFRRASCVLKSLPFALTDVQQLIGYKDIGEHVRKVLALFTNVFGVGPAIAKSWIDKGWQSIADVRLAGSINKDWRISWGLAFYEDLLTPVTMQEAEAFETLIRTEMKKISPLSIVTVTGGFRRGKSNGHDIDILMTHPDEGAETNILSKLMGALNKCDLVLKGYFTQNTFSSEMLSDDSKKGLRSHFDHFEKWIGICKFPKSFQTDRKLQSVRDSSETLPESAQQLSHYSRTIQHQDVLPSEHVNISADNTMSPCSKHTFKTDDKQKSLTLKRERTEMLEDSSPKSKRFKYEDLSEKEVISLANSDRNWTARRVDLIVSPYSQYYYALVGWTGSKHFNRDIRLYAQKVLGLRLTSHGLFDMKKGEALPASSEEEVFRHLQLPYRDPMERNC
ncbi:DNA-directed DNA/RNA polymerase mu-like isoform X2 [Biomphalaria glabrata]|uniref:DNA-directed DNA/RNA polymerase mu-like isoform X2 n=1 Tax=Biomphalaria glabrata TaxID=6526 RepID=A0A9W3AFR8_BIOGL|nr:DNA-directed DNA/RNA polymerase mu-like isoform X2 [Biomphalaria glabrata]